MTVQGALGVLAGALAGSVALIGWGLASTIGGLAAVIVIWRFTGSRGQSETAGRRAERAVAVSFFLLAPYMAVEALRALEGDPERRHEHDAGRRDRDAERRGVGMPGRAAPARARTRLRGDRRCRGRTTCPAHLRARPC
jgi:hypothetical protein